MDGWEVEELTEIELAEGDSRLEFLGGCAGESERPLPRTRPPPSLRADMSSPAMAPHGHVVKMLFCYL